MARKRQNLTCQLYVQCLENREVPSITLANRIWTATGTEQNDIIVVDRKPNTNDDLRIRILDRATGTLREQNSRDTDDVDQVVLQGLDGNDILVNWTSRPGSLSGGAGEDALTGGFGDDVLDGGSASDFYIFTDTLTSVNWYGSAIIPVNDPNAPAFHSLGTDHIRNESALGGWDAIDLEGIMAGVSLDLAQVDVAQTV